MFHSGQNLVNICSGYFDRYGNGYGLKKAAKTMVEQLLGELIQEKIEWKEKDATINHGEIVSSFGEKNDKKIKDQNHLFNVEGFEIEAGLIDSSAAHY